jgi:hypothetical protein
LKRQGSLYWGFAAFLKGHSYAATQEVSLAASTSEDTLWPFASPTTANREGILRGGYHSIVKEQKGNRPCLSGGGPRPWKDGPFSHQVTKLHTFSFFAIPAILPIVAQTGNKQGKAASLPR